MTTLSNIPFIEQWYRAYEEWADLENAANILEGMRGVLLERRIKELGDIPYNRAERDVKSSDWYENYLRDMHLARDEAVKAKGRLELIRMRSLEHASEEANERVKARL